MGVDIERVTKERPILLNEAMVTAVFQDQKTQTRRIIKLPQFEPTDEGLGSYAAANLDKCPYGEVGDRLWVRETWRPKSWGSDFDWMMIEYRADGGTSGRTKQVDPYEVWGDSGEAEVFWEKLTKKCVAAGCPQSESGDFVLQAPDGTPLVKWKPSIFMPRLVSRISLEITEVGVSRVKQISEADAIAEGVEQVADGWKCYGDCTSHKTGHSNRTSATASFTSLWDSINAKTWDWDSNPWVWVINFKVVAEAKTTIR